MTWRGHVRLASYAAAVWLGFFLLGLPDYYQQYPARAVAVFELALLFPVAFACRLALRRRGHTPRLVRARTLALHFTVPLFAYDWVYCGVHLGHGLGFLARYWYLTTYYAVPWILLPATALWLDRVDAARAGRPARAKAAE